MQKLIGECTVQEVIQEKPPKECWYILHHLVAHNGEYRLIFNCSHQYLGQTLNQYLLPGPTLGASLVGVLLRFREHPIAVRGDIKGMFHQIHLLPEDRPLLRFLWHDLKVDEPPRVFEWQVLPFGTTCSLYPPGRRSSSDNCEISSEVGITHNGIIYLQLCFKPGPTGRMSFSSYLSLPFLEHTCQQTLTSGLSPMKRTSWLTLLNRPTEP